MAAVFVALRDYPKTNSTPWTTLHSRRFGGDVYERLITLQEDTGDRSAVSVSVKAVGSNRFDLTVNAGGEPTTFASITARLTSPTKLSLRIGNAYRETTIVSQKPSPTTPASTSHNTMERLHLFVGGQKITLVLPSPKWLLSLGGDILGALKGGLKAPMPSLVVEVKVKVGERVEKGQAVVVLESMKTETVMRADRKGVVRSVGCKSGEMVEEGRELMDIEEEEGEVKEETV